MLDKDRRTEEALKSAYASKCRSFNKDLAWQNLQRKRHGQLTKKVLGVAAMVAIITSVLFQFKGIINHEITAEQEKQNRQKLQEYEQKLSGKYYILQLCHDCDGVYLKKIELTDSIESEIIPILLIPKNSI